MKVFVNTDIGDDIDDAWAITALLQMPSVEIALVLIDSYKAEERAAVLAEFLFRNNRSDVAIGIGAGEISESDHWKQLQMRTYPRAGALAMHRGPVYRDGVNALISLAMAMPKGERGALLQLGPCPNIRTALEREPALAERLDVFAMGGSIRRGFDTTQAPIAEWNVHADPASWQEMFAAPWPIALAPIDVGAAARLSHEVFREVQEASQVQLSLRVLLEAHAHWMKSCCPLQAAKFLSPQGDLAELEHSSKLFDLAALSLLPQMQPQHFFQLEELPLVVEDDGIILESQRGRHVSTATDWRSLDDWQVAMSALLVRGELPAPPAVRQQARKISKLQSPQRKESPQGKTGGKDKEMLTAMGSKRQPGSFSNNDVQSAAITAATVATTVTLSSVLVIGGFIFVLCRMLHGGKKRVPGTPPRNSRPASCRGSKTGSPARSLAGRGGQVHASPRMSDADDSMSAMLASREYLRVVSELSDIDESIRPSPSGSVGRPSSRASVPRSTVSGGNDMASAQMLSRGQGGQGFSSLQKSIASLLPASRGKHSMLSTVELDADFEAPPQVTQPSSH